MLIYKINLTQNAVLRFDFVVPCLVRMDGYPRPRAIKRNVSLFSTEPENNQLVAFQNYYFSLCLLVLGSRVVDFSLSNEFLCVRFV